MTTKIRTKSGHVYHLRSPFELQVTFDSMSVKVAHDELVLSAIGNDLKTAFFLFTEMFGSTYQNVFSSEGWDTTSEGKKLRQSFELIVLRVEEPADKRYGIYVEGALSGNDQLNSIVDDAKNYGVEPHE